MIPIRNAAGSVLTLALVFASATLAVAQRVSNAERQSHISVPDDDLATDLGNWLKGQSGAGGKNPFDSELFRSLLPDLKDTEALAEWVRKNPDLLKMYPPKQFESHLREYLEKNPTDPKLRAIDPERFARRMEQLVPPMTDPNELKGQNPNPSTMPFRPPAPMPPTPSPDPPNPNSRTGELSRWFRENLGESPAVKNMIKDLAGKFGEGNSLTGPSWLPDLKTDGAAFGKWAERNLGFLQDVKLPEFKLGGVKLPSVGSGGGGAPSFGGGSSGSSGPSGGGSWAGLIILVLMAAAGFAVWIILVQKRGHSERARQARRVRNWPVDPALISTRAELVQAFDYLSLTRCGEEARTWNHRAIAGQMGADGLPQKEAAGTLAGLYEQARYAPQDETLTESQYAEARRQFRVLGDGSPA